jgi:transglutaminase-like putative cysteine protease
MSGQQRLSLTSAVATAATALSLHTVFAGGGWFFPIMIGIALVFATTSAARGARLPSFLHPIAAGIVVLLWITVLDARDVAVGGVIPGPGAFRELGTVTRAGLHDVHRLATPVPTHRGVILLAVVGVAAVGLVVDLLVVQLRRSALAGLPLLGLFTTCAGVGRHGAGIFSYLVSASAFLWLLFVDNREQVNRWGTSVSNEPKRRRSVWSESTPDPAAGSTATALGRRIGGAAIGLGVIVPLIIPGLHTGIGRHTIGTGTGPGGSSVVTVNPIVSVASDLRASKVEPVLRYRSSTSAPGYLRLTSLDLFDGSTFSTSALAAKPNSRVDGTVPDSAAPKPTSGNPTITTTITVANLAVHWLPVDSEPSSVKVDGEWLYDPGTGTIFSAKDSTAGKKYTTTSVPLAPTPTQLAAAPPPGQAEAADLILPGNLSPAVRQLAHKITRKAATPYAEAVEIQAYLADSHTYTYDTSVSADPGSNSLEDFLFTTRRGFCQQFSASMAVMARILGIPARVAVGFTAGTKQKDGSYLVTTRDAHAWPELWFQGIGWVPFEPTPRGDGQAVSPTYAVPTAANIGGTGPADLPNANQKPTGADINGSRTGPGNERRVQTTGGTTGLATTSTHHHMLTTSWVDLVLLLIALLIMLPGSIRLAWRWGRRRRMRAPNRAAEAAWAELRSVALDLHVPWDDMNSPRRAAAGVARVLPRDRPMGEAVTRVALAEEQSRYARDPRPPRPELWSDVNLIAGALRSRLQPVQRARYRVFPRSVLITVRPLAARAADVLDGADSWIAWSRRLLRIHPRRNGTDS